MVEIAGSGKAPWDDGMRETLSDENSAGCKELEESLRPAFLRRKGLHSRISLLQQ